MKALARFITKHNKLILIVMVALAIICAMLMPHVTVNSDMTKYLSNKSSMKIGTDIMTEELGSAETGQTIKAMFAGLSDEERVEMKETLSAIPYVDSVDYDAEDDDYNSGDYALYVINTTYDYDSDEELSIEHTLENDFAGYDLTWENQDTSKINLPMKIIMVALLIMMVILFVMSQSWVEPILFAITIGIAVLINMGSNILLGSVSNITEAIAAILQLVLSMDYSIILMNRYRQELERVGEKRGAMESALTMAFPSVASSGLTTIVGLLMLVFMSFKIGLDLGVVLAKGVFISMICVFTVLPGLVMITSNLVVKTKKPVPDIPLFRLSGGIYKVRWLFIPLMCVIFVGAFFLQKNTEIAYSLESDDPITAIFPEDNSIVMLFDNEDEDEIIALVDEFEDDVHIKSASSYPTQLGKQYAASEMADSMANMSGDFDITPEMIAIIYYDYFSDDELPMLTASEFIRFVAYDVVDNDTFAEYLDDDIKDNIDMMVKFADKDALTTPMTAEELADFLDMDVSDLKNVMLFYYIENGGVSSEAMTLPVFADFVVNEIATDPDYGGLFDADTLGEMQTLLDYADAAAMTRERTYTDMAGFMGMDASDMKLLYVYYYALQESYAPSKMTIPEFVNFLCDDIANDETFSDYFDSSALGEMQTLKTYTDVDLITSEVSIGDLAYLFSMDESAVKSLMVLYYNENGGADAYTMTLPTFVNFLVDEVAADSTYSSMFDADTLAQMQMMATFTDVTAMTTEMDAETMASQIGASLELDESTLGQIYQGIDCASYSATAAAVTYNSIATVDATGASAHTFQEVASYLAANGDDQAKAQFQTISNIINYSVADAAFTPADLASAMGMDSSQCTMLYLLYISRHGDTSSWKISPDDFINFIVGSVMSNDAYSSMFDSSAAGQIGLLQFVMNASIYGTAYDYPTIADKFGMDYDTAKMLFTYHDSTNGEISWTLSVQTVVNFIVDHADLFGDLLGGNLDDLTMAQKIINGSVAGTRYSAEGLANLLGMDSDEIRELYLLYISRHGDTSSWKLTVQEFVNFVLDDVMSDPDYADLIDVDTADELETAKTLIDAVVAGDAYTAEGLAGLFSGLSNELDTDTMELLYLYYAAVNNADDSWTMSLHELVNYLADDVVNDPRFDTMIDDDMKESIIDMRDELEDGISQMKGENYQILLFTTTFPEESEETTAFIEDLSAYSDEHLNGDYYLIGESPMVYEMEQGFKSELNLITWLTIISIFIVVAISFHSLVVPLILVVIVQCGVYITMSTCGLIGYSIYYLALLIVQCILMGATIDYGILFTNYYRENRVKGDKLSAVKAAYRGSSHTIFTSGLIMIIVTFIIGISPADATIAQICLTIAIGVTSAVVLIVLILPGILLATDRFVVKRRKE